MDAGEWRNVPSSTGVQDALDLALFCMLVETILRKFMTRFELKGTEATVYMNWIAISSLDVKPGKVKVATLLKKEVRHVGVMLNESPRRWREELSSSAFQLALIPW